MFLLVFSLMGIRNLHVFNQMSLALSRCFLLDDPACHLPMNKWQSLRIKPREDTAKKHPL